jgi:hypothetical protein
MLRTKLDPCATRYVFVGYSDLQKGYKCYDPHTQKLHITLDVSFRETESKEGSIISFQEEQSSNEHLLQESDRNEFVELENIIKQFGSSGTNEKSRGRSTDEDSQINIELPLLTPLTNESS